MAGSAAAANNATPAANTLPTDKQLRSLVTSMTGSRLLEASDFTFHADSKHVFFLGHDSNQMKQLMCVDYSTLAPPASTSGDSKSDSKDGTVTSGPIPVPAAWKPLVSFPGEFRSDREFTEAEKLLRERTRQLALGVTNYTYNAARARLLIPAGGTLYVADVPSDLSAVTDSKSSKPLALREVKSTHVLAESEGGDEVGPIMDAKFSPDCALIAYVRGADLFFIQTRDPTVPVSNELRAVSERRLTYASRSTYHKHTTCGVADYIMQEEFDRFTGFWWCPVVEANTYRILYLEVDESRVPTIGIARPTTGTVDTMRFPRPGQINARSNVKIVEFNGVHPGAVASQTFELKVPVHDHWPWVEYIPRVGWIDRDRFWLHLLDRRQQRTAIVVLSIKNDCVRCVNSSVAPPPPAEHPMRTPKPVRAAFHGNPPESRAHHPMVDDSKSSSDGERMGQIVYEETTKVWINITNHTVAAADGSGLIHASERTGYRHLYWIPLPPASAAAATAIPTPIAITSGEWPIDKNSLLSIDEEKRVIYFTGNAESAVDKHLYWASYAPEALAASGAAVAGKQHRRLTVEGTFNDVWVCTGSNAKASSGTVRFVSAFSTVRTTTQTVVVEVQNATPKVVAAIPMRGRAAVPAFPISPPELVTFPSTDGKFTIHGAIFKPPASFFAAGKRPPLLVHLYGGPAVQLVTNTERFASTARFQMLASLGFVIAVCDGRGSARRGLGYEAPLRDSMGTVEVQDQAALAAYVCTTRGLADPKRVVCSGWSYGGYLAALCLAQRGDVFKIGVCGAPVTDWAFYDTGYTERYMGTPTENPAGYKAGNVVTVASQFPDEENRLVIAHGLIDENVHFTHTAALIHALTQNNKPYVLKVFPEERHGIRNQASSMYFELFFLGFVTKHL